MVEKEEGIKDEMDGLDAAEASMNFERKVSPQTSWNFTEKLLLST